MNEYGPALRRFWPVVLVGVLLSALAAIAAIYKLPSLEPRATQSYTATARMLVTGADAPYIRTSLTEVSSELVRDAAGGTQGTQVVQTSPPDVTAYVRAANLYPVLVESDQVRQYRESLFGPAEGEVTANAIYQVATPSRFRLSDVPVIQVFGTAETEQQAIDLTTQTTDAFIAWIREQQKDAGVPSKQRILIQRLQVPSEANASAGPSTALALLVFLAGAFATCLLAILLDRLWPSSAAKEARGTRESREPSADPGVDQRGIAVVRGAPDTSASRALRSALQRVDNAAGEGSAGDALAEAAGSSAPDARK